MTCTVHPGNAVVGNCVNCGRGVCEECKVRVSGRIHCRQCVERGQIKLPSPPQQQAVLPTMMPGQPAAGRPVHLLPMPRGEPSAFYFKAGSVSALLSSVFAFSAGIFLAMYIFVFTSSVSDATQGLLIVILMLLMLSLIPLLYGYYGFHINYGSVGALLSLVGAAMFFTIYLGILFYWIFYHLTSPGSNAPPIIQYGEMTLGVGLIIAAVPLYGLRLFVPPDRSARRLLPVAFVMMLLCGILFVTTIGFYVFGWFVFGATLVLVGYMFWKLPVPEGPLPMLGKTTKPTA